MLRVRSRLWAMRSMRSILLEGGKTFFNRLKFIWERCRSGTYMYVMRTIYFEGVLRVSLAGVRSWGKCISADEMCGGNIHMYLVV